MIIGKPAPFVHAFIDVGDEARRAQSPSHGLSARPRAWLAFCVTAGLGTNSSCWARFARASLGPYALAALSWMVRHSKMPGDVLLVASVRVIRRHYGLTGGRLVIDATDKKRSKAATTLAHLSKRRDKDSGGYIWGQSLGVLVLVTPHLTLPVGFAFSQPAPELSAWDKQDKVLRKQGVLTKQRPPKPPPHPPYPPKHARALRLLPQFKAPHPDLRGPCITAAALYGTAPCGDGAAGIVGGVQVISQRRSPQNGRVQQHEQHGADYFATHPATPHTLRIRGGEEVVACIGRARLYVWSHKTTRCIVALKYESDETSRSLLAADLTGRTLAIGQGPTRRWLVEVFVQAWKAPEGWSQLTKQPGAEGARRSVILRLLVEHCLFFHPDQRAQLTHNWPA